MLEAIVRHTSSIEGEIALAHRLDMRNLLEKQSEEQQKTRESLSRVEVSGFSSKFSHAFDPIGKVGRRSECLLIVTQNLPHMRRKIMKWLSPMDMEEIRSRESQRRTQPSGEWLLRHKVFQGWLRF